MKALRTTVFLVAFLVLPLLAGQVFGQITYSHLDSTYVPFDKISQNTDDKPLLGFRIDFSGGGGSGGLSPEQAECLERLTLTSFITKAFSVEYVKLYAETNNVKGLQVGGDTPVAILNTNGFQFDSNDTLVFGGIHYCLNENPGDSNLFYIAIDAHTDSVGNSPSLYDGECLEVAIMPGRLVLTSESNPDTIYNELIGGDPLTGFCPGSLPASGCRYRLCFDVEGPQFDLHFCVPWEEVCCCDTTVAQEDSVQICATNVSPDIKGPITIVDSKKIFLLDLIQLKWDDSTYTTNCPDCDTNYNVIFQIPDKKNNSTYPGIDADTGQWMLCAWAEDSSGNRDTICISHDDLPWKIDTRKPNIDSVQVYLSVDNNGDGIIGLHDCITVVGWGLSNPWEPEFEVDSMIVDLRRFKLGWHQLDDVLEHNRVFRGTFCLDSVVCIDTADCDLNAITVWAFDNACNYDTLREGICDTIDLDPPGLAIPIYEYYFDFDTTFACIGIGDQVYIGATVNGPDIVSVTADMKDAGIDELNRTDMPLPFRGGALYDTIWTVTEPPIDDGKDADNSTPPPIDSDYSITITVCDDAENCTTATSGQLNRTLDTRVPRPIGFNCPDSTPCALHIRPLPGGIIELYWDRDCDEADAWYFYVWADDGLGYDSIGATYEGESGDPNFNFWNSEPLPEGYYKFKIKTEDNCSNVGDFSCEVGAFADATPPHVCIALPDSGLVFGAPFPVKAVADSASHDVDSSCLWYRFRPDLDGGLDPIGPWTFCGCMSRPGGDGYVFTDTMSCIYDYTGWVELITVSCDEVGNCQDTTMGYDDACLVVDDMFRPGHFLFYWDTLAPGVHLTSVNGFISPQSSCGYDVERGIMNEVVIDVDGAGGELFEVEVRALSNIPPNRIFHQDSCSMPCTIWVSVDGWDEGTQYLYIKVKDYDNDKEGNLQVDLCVPPKPLDHCIYISSPHEWTRIPCTGTSGSKCVWITADIYEHVQCQGVTFTQARFQWSPTGTDPWFLIEEVVGSGDWSTCWDNTGQVEHGDTVYLRVIAHDEYYMADTSYMVKVFVDCEGPNVALLIEDLYYTCGNETPKVPCDPLTLKAVLGDTLIDLDWVKFFVKRHSDPDIWTYWNLIAYGEPAWSDNIYMYYWSEPCCLDDAQVAPSGGGIQQEACMEPGDFWDIRIAAKDISNNVMFDYDEDRRFDDSTFNDAVAFGAGITVFVDDEAPEPAISMVRDEGTGITIINPSELLGGTDDAYVQAGNDITVQVSVLPSEDTCEVMKVEWFLQIRSHDHFGHHHWGDYVHVGTSTDANHFPITFNPLTLGLIPPERLEDGHWVGRLKAELYDSLGNNEDDRIDLYILDVTPTQAVIIEPLNDSYVWGDVTLKVAALNDYEICKVCYEYSSDGETWYPINGGYPNACLTEEPDHHGGHHHHRYFELDWHTLNTVPDGEYYLRAVATDCDNNVDDDPHTIKVMVANELPTAAIDDPRICERTCPDSPEDTLGYVSGTVMLFASASSIIPVDHVTFLFKDRFDDADDWEEIDTDYFPTDGKYSVLWDTEEGDLEGGHYHKVSDGRYYLKARAYNAAGRYGDSDPVEVSVDNSAPFSQITAIMGGPVPPDGYDITLGDVIDIELVAIDSTSPYGWTRCYNSGLTGIELCIEDCVGGTEYTKCFEVSPATDGFHTVQWNTSGLEFDGCYGCYKFYVRAWDCLGNVGTSSSVTVYVSDVTAPITTIGGFDGNYIYGYSSEKVSTVLFEYADSGGTQWTPIGISEYVGAYCNYLYKTSWDPTALDDGAYQLRVISHDSCSNQDDDMAPIAFIRVIDGAIVPHGAGMEAMSFLKNWCVGDMQGVVEQTVSTGTPVMLARFIDPYGSYHYECVDMDAHQQNSTQFAGTFNAMHISYGGSAKFFSSVTVDMSAYPPPMTGVTSMVTYLTTGTFDVAKATCNTGTYGMYQNGCVELTIPDGAVGCTGPSARYVWVAPTYMEWAPVSQPDILPIGDNDGYATYVSFTDCFYCCGWITSPYFGDEEYPATGAGTKDDGYGDCCLRAGKYAKIKMCYDENIDLAKEHLAVAWWDCVEGEYCFDGIYYPATVEGFDTDNHTVEFAVECLPGPFVVVQLLERECEGTISVNMLNVEPYCNGYTWPWPRFTAKITDNVQGTEAIDQESIIFKVGEAGDLTTIYNGAHCDYECNPCDCWARGYGQYPDAGYDLVSGLMRAGWNDPNYYWTVYYTQSDPSLCPECKYSHTYQYEKYFHCPPATGLAEGDGYMASVTAQNYNIQTCTATMEFDVDATPPTVAFADSVGAYVGANPHFCIYFNDAKAGLDKSSIYIDLYGDETSSPDPNYHNAIGTISPAQLNWINDTTVCIDGTFEYRWGYLHVYVYGGPDCLCSDCTTPQYYHYECGINDCVGNQTDVFWQYFTVDADGPSIDLVDCDAMLMFQITDDLSGVAGVYVYEDGILVDGAITQDEINPEYWWYSPASGAEEAVIKVMDHVGNVTNYSFSLPVDCAGPTVKFADQYVCKNPTIEFWVTDDAGVDWTSVNVFITGCGEDCYFYAEDLGDYVDTETGKVSIDGCHLDCYDGNEIIVYVYSGTNYRGDGPKDVNGNYGKYRQCSFVVDAVTPSISATSLSDRPIVFTISDARSGVDWETFQFYEDGVLICDGTECTDEAVEINTETGKVTYDPESGGADIEIRVNDMTGCNLLVRTYEVGYTADDVLAFDDPHNYANPFDPSDGGVTHIDPGLSKDCYVTVKIYDFAGELVRVLQSNKWTSTSTKITWDGTTDGGTEVANGTYLCYIYASCDGSTKTAVIKITVLKED